MAPQRLPHDLRGRHLALGGAAAQRINVAAGEPWKNGGNRSWLGSVAHEQEPDEGEQCETGKDGAARRDA